MMAGVALNRCAARPFKGPALQSLIPNCCAALQGGGGGVRIPSVQASHRTVPGCASIASAMAMNATVTQPADRSAAGTSTAGGTPAMNPQTAPGEDEHLPGSPSPMTIEQLGATHAAAAGRPAAVAAAPPSSDTSAAGLLQQLLQDAQQELVMVRQREAACVHELSRSLADAHGRIRDLEAELEETTAAAYQLWEVMQVGPVFLWPALVWACRHVGQGWCFGRSNRACSGQWRALQLGTIHKAPGLVVQAHSSTSCLPCA